MQPMRSDPASPYPDSPRPEMLAFIPESATRVFDVGCLVGNNYLGRKALGRTRRAQELRQASPLVTLLPDDVRRWAA